jgi:hypothetical protein
MKREVELGAGLVVDFLAGAAGGGDERLSVSGGGPSVGIWTGLEPALYPRDSSRRGTDEALGVRGWRALVPHRA